MNLVLSPASRWSGLKYIIVIKCQYSFHVSGFALEWIEIENTREKLSQASKSPASRWSGLKSMPRSRLLPVPSLRLRAGVD